MGTSIVDVQYGEYLEDLHHSYIKALEKFAKSKNLKELKDNLENLQAARDSAEGLIDNVKGKELESLESTLQDISTIDTVYKTLISESEKNNRQSIMGVIFFGTAIFFGFFLNVGANVFYKYFVEKSLFMQVFFLLFSLGIVGFFIWFVNKILNQLEKKENQK
jgi:hypothetical protein